MARMLEKQRERERERERKGEGKERRGVRRVVKGAD